jgi:hypothetical protein
VRHGHEVGSVTLGGRRLPVQRPRVRTADGSGELPVPACQRFTSTELLGRLAMDKMLAGLSTRRYGSVGLEPVGEQVTQAGTSTSKSTLPRKFARADRGGAGRAAGAHALLSAGPRTRHDPPERAASLREGMAETLTVLRLDVPPTLARTLALDQRDRVDDLDLPHQVGQRQALARRADGAALVRRRGVEVGQQFRRVNGHPHLAALRAALERELTETVGAVCQDDIVEVA